MMAVTLLTGRQTVGVVMVLAGTSRDGVAAIQVNTDEEEWLISSAQCVVCVVGWCITCNRTGNTSRWGR